MLIRHNSAHRCLVICVPVSHAVWHKVIALPCSLVRRDDPPADNPGVSVLTFGDEGCRTLFPLPSAIVDAGVRTAGYGEFEGRAPTGGFTLFGTRPGALVSERTPGETPPLTWGVPGAAGLDCT
jgi:hypothetical protein